jgi:hypothetical protein
MRSMFRRTGCAEPKRLLHAGDTLRRECLPGRWPEDAERHCPKVGSWRPELHELVQSQVPPLTGRHRTTELIGQSAHEHSQM